MRIVEGDKFGVIDNKHWDSIVLVIVVVVVGSHRRRRWVYRWGV